MHIDKPMFWENFVQLCKGINKSPSKVCAELGLSNSIATAWKGGAIPRPKVRTRLAEYFGVPETALFTAADDEPKTDAEVLLKAVDGFSERDMKELIAYAEVIKARNS